MARGRKPASATAAAETHGNVTQATVLEFNDELTQLLRLKKSADSAVSNCYKRAESAGLDRKTLKRAREDSQKAENERQVDHERYVRYMGWLGVPVGTPVEPLASDETDEPEPNGAAVEAVEKHQSNVAFEQGVHAGKAGANAASNPHQPGSEGYQAFSLGWASGQKEAVMALGGATRHAPR